MTRQRNRSIVGRSTAALAAAALAAGTFAVPTLAAPAPTTTAPAAAPTAAPAACATPWGTKAKGRIPVTMLSGPITDVRAGRHACFDRIVIDVRGNVAARGVRAEYVDRVEQDGSGEVVPLRGAAKLRVLVGHVVYDSEGKIVYDPRNPRELVPTRGYRTLRQVALAGSFEGMTTFGIGVARRAPYRVQILDAPSGDRIVLDVAHR